MKLVPRAKGTQDLLDLTLSNFVIDKFACHATLFGYHQISTPILEHLSLFKRTLGEYTDVVSKEMFQIAGQEDKDQLVLRPEATAPTMRAFLESQPLTPWKVFSYGPIFRYERPQKGRYRQFTQINCEAIGSSSVSQDALFILMLERFFAETLKLNSFSLQINFLGSYQDRESYTKVLKEYVDGLDGICATCQLRKEKNILRIFDCKNPACSALYEQAPKMIDYLSPESQGQWEQLQKELSLLSITYSINPRLVRGLDYYNKTVFEFVSPQLGAQNAFCAGGRYDKLAEQLGSKSEVPAIGAAIGLERLLLMLEPIREQLLVPQPPAFSIIMPLAPEQNPLALLIADTLTAAGIYIDALLDGDSLKSMLRRANKMGAAHAIIIGETEMQNKTVLVKNLMTSEQQEVPQVDLVGYLKR